MISELQAQMSALVDGLNAAASAQTPWGREEPAQQDAGQTGNGTAGANFWFEQSAHPARRFQHNPSRPQHL
jgi:hypothetical protein